MVKILKRFFCDICNSELGNCLVLMKYIVQDEKFVEMQRIEEASHYCSLSCIAKSLENADS